MGSHYDPKQNCRVGTMDEEQFYSESSPENGALFRSLIEAWKKAGGGRAPAVRRLPDSGQPHNWMPLFRTRFRNFG